MLNAPATKAWKVPKQLTVMQKDSDFQ